MTLLGARIAIVVGIGALLAGGCGDGGGTGPSSDQPASVEVAYSSMGTREDAHHRAAMDATDRVVLRAETARYAVDMDSLMGAMMDSCTAMGASGMMHDREMRHMGDVTARMGEMIRRHHARMVSFLGLDEMRAECAEHHEQMLDLLEDLHDALHWRGMMAA